MWKIGAVLVLAVVFAETSSADAKHGPLLDRLKRSPHFCGPPFDHQHHPPPFWPGGHDDDDDDDVGGGGPPPPYWPPPPPSPYQYQYQPPEHTYAAGPAQTPSRHQSEPIKQEHPRENNKLSQDHAESQGHSENQGPAQSQGHIGQSQTGQAQGRCDNCPQDTVVSHAQSQLGDAIAIAIARARPSNTR